MASINEEVTGNESSESCPELDDDYFAQMDQSFQVIDAWEDGKGSNDSLPAPILIKTESTSDKNIKPRSSLRNHSESSSNRNEVRKDKENARKKSRSPRRRSPPNRRPNRFSPHAVRPPIRSRSPPRRRSPKPKKSFLEEMQEKFPGIANPNMQQTRFPNNQMPFSNPMQPNPLQFGYPAGPMIPFMPGPNYMQQPQFPLLDNFSQPYPLNQPFNQMINPGMNQMAQNRMPVAPNPVPAPNISDLIPEAPTFHNPARVATKTTEQVQDQVKRPGPSEIFNAKKKAFDSGQISISDYLRQVVNQKSKETTSIDISMKKEKVRERCKKAAELLKKMSGNHVKLPFTVCSSKFRAASSVNCLSRSKLIMSDNNSQFISQANEKSYRDAFRANPLRNISGSFFQFSRNLGMDLEKLSEEVYKAKQKEDKKQKDESENISLVKINKVARLGDRGTQTDPDYCDKCLIQQLKRFNSVSCQARIPNSNTLEATTQTPSEEEQGGFSVNFDSRQMQTMTRDQQQIFVEFCRAFGLHQDRYSTREAQPQWDQGNGNDRMTYTNPENPNFGGNMFLSLSPIRDQSNSRSPARRRITERLGDIVPSPQVFYDDEVIDTRPPHFPQQIPVGYRIPTPPSVHGHSREHERQSPLRGFRNRSRSRSPPSRFRRSRSPPNVPFANRRGRY